MNKATLDLARELARDLRKRQTHAESLLWSEVRNRKLSGRKFLRQHPLFFEYGDKDSFFIADFYCHECRLVVEVDGKSHDYLKDYDDLRTYIINSMRINVVRVRNEEIEDDLPGVLRKLRAIVSTQRDHVTPMVDHLQGQ